MYQLISLPYDAYTYHQYGESEGLSNFLRDCRCDGFELIWGGDAFSIPYPKGAVTGYHLTFYSDWLDFYRNDPIKLAKKYPSDGLLNQIYGGESPSLLIQSFREDLARAIQFGAPYVVFHVSDVSIEEGYTYQWEHSDEAVIDACCEIINEVFSDMTNGPILLLENLWWAGFRFTDLALTKRLLDKIRYSNIGIMLDTGHLLNTNPSIETEKQGCAYILDQINKHAEISKLIRGVHLHQSLSGSYVNRHTGFLPPDLPTDFNGAFAASYHHVRTIDTHMPFTDPAVKDLIKAIAPDFLVHELAASDPAEKKRLLQIQQKALGF